MILNQVSLLEADVLRLCGEGDSSVEGERLDAIRREIARIGEILERLSEIASGDQYETVNYIGPTRMVDLRRRIEKINGHLPTVYKDLLALDDQRTAAKAPWLPW